MEKEIYATRKPLSHGIKKIRAEIDENKWASYFNGFMYEFYQPSEWCEAEQEARHRFEHSRLKRIESLKKQIERLEKRKFSVRDLTK